MAYETRSLWEIYDSEIEPWRRGRRILLAIGAFVFLLQGLSVMAEMVLGRLEVLVVLGILIVVFWLQFYFVWIGVHWLRWVWADGICSPASRFSSGLCATRAWSRVCSEL